MALLDASTRSLAILPLAAAAIALGPVPDPMAPQETAAEKPSKQEAVTYSIDPTHSMALFRVQHLGAGAFWGRFNGVSGTIVHDRSAADGLSLEVAIDISSVDTGNEGLDDHLKSPDFFAAEEFETATFRSTKAKKTGDNDYEVEGELTMRGVTRPITVEIEWVGTKATQRGTRCGFETVFTVDRTDFGIDYGAEGNMLGVDTRIVVSMEGVVAPPRGQMMERLDANKDGKIQKDELPERLQPAFDRLDANGDGALDEEELQALRGSRRGGSGGGSDS